MNEITRDDISMEALRHNGQFYLDFLSLIDASMAPRAYLEIGYGAALGIFRCDTICVDDNLTLKEDALAVARKIHLFQMTSDEFFQHHSPLTILGGEIDLAFLDGPHQFERLLRDFINTEKHCRRQSFILVHDCLPTNERMAERLPRIDENEDAETRDSWTGDVWKLLPILKQHRPDLRIFLLDAAPTGLAVCTNLDPNSQVLSENFDDIVAEYAPLSLREMTFQRLWSIFKTVDTTKLNDHPDRLAALFPPVGTASVDVPHAKKMINTPDSPSSLDARSARDICLSSNILVDGSEIMLPHCCAYSNMSEFNPDLARRLLSEAYQQRLAICSPIHLCQLSSGALLQGDSFMVESEGVLVAEQVPPDLMTTYSADQHVMRHESVVKEVCEPCIVLSRYGNRTWGHWLGELLPRAVLAEDARPGYFRFIVAGWIIDEASSRGLAKAILESLEAYGITQDRLLPLQPALNYRLSDASIITSVWSDNVIHPGVADVMRKLLTKVGPVDETTKLAIRRVSKQRQMSNDLSIMAALEEHGFDIHSVGQLPFLKQVSLFLNSDLIFATLGSDLTGLLYAPDGVKVIAAVPGTWTDRFFYALIQLRGGQFAEVRGPVATDPALLYRDLPFSISVDAVKQALKVLE